MSTSDNASPIQAVMEELKSRRQPDGGFSILPGGKSRPDATAWAMLALQGYGGEGNFLEQAGSYLQSFQLKDERVVIGHEEPQVIWVTYVAAWAWQGIPQFQAAQKYALDFILKTSGNWNYFRRWGLAHDPSLKGWPWVENTSSWVDSTVLALLALRVAGLKRHARYLEGIRMLQDRELPSGGWNCGNTIVYGTELRPTSESSGMAMALMDIQRDRHAASMRQLRGYIRKESGPLTLGWALLSVGLPEDLPVLEQALISQQRKGYCQTEWLSLLTMAWSRLSSRAGASQMGFGLKGKA